MKRGLMELGVGNEVVKTFQTEFWFLESWENVGCMGIGFSERESLL